MRGTLLALALAACTTQPGYYTTVHGDDAPRVEDPGYEKALKEFSRWQSVYDQLDQRAFAAATWQSWPFRKERVRVVSEFASLPDAKKQELLAAEMAEAQNYTDFFLGLFTDKREWNDLDSPHSIWRVELTGTSGGGVTPVAIERIERPDANVRALYPYVNAFWIGYRIRFPRVPPGSHFALTLSSSLGKIDMYWDGAGVEEPPPPPPAPPPPARPNP